MLTRSKTQRRFWYGTAIFVVIVLVAVSGYFAVGKSSTKAAGGFCAILPDTVGLYEGNQVTQMGYGIGVIESIIPGDDGVRVDFTVDSSRSIPADVKVVTRSKSVLADRSLELVGNYTSGPRLTAGQCVSSENAYTPKSISQITGSAADLIDQIAPNGDTRAVQGAIGGMSEALAGTGPDIARLMETAAAAADSPERIVSDIGSIILNMAPLTGTALEQWEDIASIVNQTPAATDAMADKMWPGVIDLITGLKPILNAIWDFYPKYANKYLYPTLDSVAEGIHIAATHAGDIKNALSALPSLSAAVALVAVRGKGAALEVAAPSVRIQTGDAQQLCARLNAVHQGGCISAGTDATLTHTGVLDLLMAGGLK